MKDPFLRELDNALEDGYINQKEYDRFLADFNEYTGEQAALAKELESGAIDRDTYVEKYGQTTQKMRALEAHKTRVIDERMKSKRKRSENKYKRRFITILIILAVAFGAYKVWDYIYRHRSIAGIPEPVQINLEGNASDAVHVVYGSELGRPDYTLSMNYLAEYDIKGLVIDTKHLGDETVFDKSFPVDVSLGWGEYAAHRTVMDCVNGPRKLSCTYNEREVSKIGLGRSIINLVSNNHLSPASREIYDKIMRIRPGNYIELKGYLVHFTVDDGVQKFEATSSLSRTDHMDGVFDTTNTGCELFYVTSVEWLD